MSGGLYYFADFRNCASILKKGILSKILVQKSRIRYWDFSDPEVQQRRHFKQVFIGSEIQGINLHEFVPLYWVTKTPTLFARKNIQDRIFFIEIDYEIIESEEKFVIFSDGNAASNQSSFFDNFDEASMYIDWDVINSQYWTSFADGTRKRNAEVLIHKRIEPIWFNKIIVNNDKMFDYICKIFDSVPFDSLREDLQIEKNPKCFF